VLEGERSVGELARELNLTLSNVSQHLRMMYDRGGTVIYGREGKTIFYHLSNRKFFEGYLKIRKGLLEQLQQKNDITRS